MYISLYDLGFFIILIIILVVSGYLIAVLHRLFSMLGHIRGVLDTHHDEIHQTIAELPIALANVNELAISLKTIVDHTDSAFGLLEDNVVDTVDDLRSGMENFVIYAKVAAEVCRAVFSKSG